MLISTHIALLEAGKSFGELALLHNKQRAASIKVVEDCYFATMNKKSFDKVMLKIKLRENNKIVSFFDKFNFIKPLTYQTKTKLAYYGKEIKYSIGQTVFNEGDLCSTIYLIKDGEFEISKDIYSYKDHMEQKPYCLFSQVYWSNFIKN